MPRFKYRARDSKGKLKMGERDALSDSELNSQLIAEGIYPLEILEKKSTLKIEYLIKNFFLAKEEINSDLLIFARQMQLLYKAGVPINDSLKQLASSSRSVYFKSMLIDLAYRIEKGQSLSLAMQSFPMIFSPVTFNIIKVGESSGKLGDAFGFLFNYLEFDLKNKKELKSIFRYPAFILLTIFSAFIVLNIYVIPTFSKMYQGLRIQLPWETRLLISTSDFIVNYGYIILIFLACCFAYGYRYFKTVEGKLTFDRLIFKIPLFGSIFKRLTLVRFSRLMAIVLDSGISINESLTLTKEAIGNSFISKQINKMILEINRGVSFSQTLKQSDIFSSFELQILKVGEQSGDLVPSLKYICDFHNMELEYDIKRIQDLTGPALVSITAILVLIMALGIYLPIWNMINLAKT